MHFLANLLETFYELSDNLQQASYHQRHLLQATNLSLPLTMQASFCYPTGACDLTSLANGNLGFMYFSIKVWWRIQSE